MPRTLKKLFMTKEDFHGEEIVWKNSIFSLLYVKGDITPFLFFPFMLNNGVHFVKSYANTV